MNLKICKNCNAEFEITTKDQDFYTKMKVPEPTHCPTCRRQRKLAFRNERCLYHHHCDLCNKSIISVFSENTRYTVYCPECWWSDTWDPLTYGQNLDFSKPFFEQFSQLEKSIPHFSLFQEGTSENCKYVNYGSNNKSCYLALCAYCEDIYYSNAGLQSKSCMDCTKFLSCELCYDCIDCTKCYNLLFSQDCNNCSNSYFLKDCTSCRNCFCSAGLRNKQFIFMNEQLEEEDYKNRFSQIKLTNKEILDWQTRRDELSSKIPKKYINAVNSENVTGNHLYDCKDLENCFDCFSIENLKNCDFMGIKSHNLYDSSYAGMGCESCYEINGALAFNNCKFIYYGRYLQDCEYCQCCYNSSHLFGCFGLNHKQYCVFNRQYTTEDYDALVKRIVKKMSEENSERTKEYGEFFPISTSPFAYNETVANEYYQLTKEQALERGYKWHEEENVSKIIQTYRVPENIENVSDMILKEILSCRECGKSYKVINQELDFYRKLKLPIPPYCHNCRHKTRFNKRNPRKLWSRQCQKCQANIKTSYSPDRPETIYCEKCYLEFIV